MKATGFLRGPGIFPGPPGNRGQGPTMRCNLSAWSFTS